MKKTFFDVNDKYNTITIKYYFIQGIRNDNYTKRNLLSSILLDSTKNYKTIEEVNLALDNFYGAYLSSRVIELSNRQAVYFKLEFLNPSILNDPNYTIENVYNFFKEIIYNSNIKNDKFDDYYFKREKEGLKIYLKEETTNPDLYSTKKALELVYKDTIFEKSIEGNLEELKEITNENLYKEYLNMINNDDLIIEIIGNIKESDKQIFDIYSDTIKLDYYNIIENENYEEIVEYLECDSSYLRLVYKTNIKRFDKDFYAFLVFKEILGGDAYSILFSNVREKEGLCYSIGATIFSNKSLLMIYATINNKDYHKVIASINKEILNIQNGNIDSKLINTVKEAIIDYYNKLEDRNDNKVNDDILNEVYDIKGSYYDIINEIKKVTYNDVIRVSRSIKLIRKYYLNGDTNDRK
ncbi:MAG: M16 family metallopeptidase [Anaeroplasmataceae bacterium]